MVINAFYENVSAARLEGRTLADGEDDPKVVLKFKPNPPIEMFVACWWSRWQGKDETDLLSFAAITDEPPPEIAAAGYDRCVIPIHSEQPDARLNPDAGYLTALQAILDARERPYLSIAWRPDSAHSS